MGSIIVRSSVDPEIDGRVASLYERHKAMDWTSCCPFAGGLLAAWAIFELHIPPVATFAGMVFCVLAGSIWTQRLYRARWHDFGMLRESHNRNVAVALLSFMRSEMSEDHGPHARDFEVLRPAFELWADEGKPPLSTSTVKMLEEVALAYPRSQFLFGRQPPGFVPSLLHDALLQSNRIDVAARLEKRLQS